MLVKILNRKIHSTEKSKIEPLKIFAGNLNSKHLDYSTFILVAVNKIGHLPAALTW